MCEEEGIHGVRGGCGEIERDYVSTLLLYAQSILPFFRDFPGIQLNAPALSIPPREFYVMHSPHSISGSLKW